MARRKDGYLEKTITINGHRVHVYGHTEREIREKIDELYDEKYKGITNDITFRDYGEHWYPIVTAELSENTRLSYRRTLNHAIRLLGDLRVQDIKRSEIEKALNDLNDRPTMKEKTLMIIRRIIDMAVDDEICKYNPASNIRANKPCKETRDRLSHRETEAVKKAIMRDDLRLFVDILFHTGIRKGEALGLTRKSIGDGVIHIREQRQFDRKGNPYTTTLKTYNSRRDIPIPAELEKRLRDYAKSTDTIYLFDQISTRRRFVTAWKKVEIAIVRVNNPDYKPPKKIGELNMKDIPCDITPHVFRHNFCSVLHDQGVDVLVARDLMGHADITTTLAIYTHLDKDKKFDHFNEVRDIMSAM